MVITHFTFADLAHCHAHVYFPADGDHKVLQEILNSVYPHLVLTSARVVVPRGDLNTSCRWAAHLPVARAPLCDLILPMLARPGLRRLSPLAEAPTWVSPQGFMAALEDILLPSPSAAAHSTEVRSDSSFPSDHMPILIVLYCLPPGPQPTCPSERGRLPIPRKPLDGQLHTLNDTFEAAALQPPLDTIDNPPHYATVTAALYAAATAAYGPPSPMHPAPAAVHVHVLSLQRVHHGAPILDIPLTPPGGICPP